MWLYGAIIVLCLGVLDVMSASIPAYIKPCRKTEDFKSCAIKSGNEVLPFLMKGDPKYKIPNLSPLKIPLVDLQTGPNLKFKLTDIKIFGIDTISLKDFDLDFQKQTAYLKVEAKYLEIIATYDIDGKIMVLPIQGHGPFNLKMDDCKFEYTLSYKIENKDGADYAILQEDDELAFKIGNAHFKMDNLFNGNQAMGDNVNKFFNENSQDVLNELGGAVKEIVKAIAHSVEGGILGSIPFHELFLE